MVENMKVYLNTFKGTDLMEGKMDGKTKNVYPSTYSIQWNVIKSLHGCHIDFDFCCIKKSYNLKTYTCIYLNIFCV